MTTFVIATPRLELRLKTPTELLAWVQSLPPEVQKEVSPAWVERVRITPAGDPWALGFAVVERASGAEIGGCAFKGPPDSDGVVEVAYGIDAEFRRKGYAGEATAGLVAFAFERGVRTVRGHCKADNPASVRVLEKNGFRNLGMVIDPEDGEVLRWERGKM